MVLEVEGLAIADDKFIGSRFLQKSRIYVQITNLSDLFSDI
ncbi:hypothetical protein NIES4101_35050 [Calothrix sp. NIES-4101]|nr:hypothetical protein NIES4101_35050 [Calothrix sp. NIES-4101]